MIIFSSCSSEPALLCLEQEVACFGTQHSQQSRVGVVVSLSLSFLSCEMGTQSPNKLRTITCQALAKKSIQP